MHRLTCDICHTVVTQSSHSMMYIINCNNVILIKRVYERKSVEILHIYTRGAPDISTKMATRTQNNQYKHKLNCRPATTCESYFPKDAVENSIPEVRRDIAYQT
jgi:hypothetical protein